MRFIRGVVNAAQEGLDAQRGRRDAAASLVVAGRNVVQGKLLADGGFAYVYVGTDTDTGEQLAVRKVLLQDAEALEKAKLEIELLGSLCDHPYVVRYLGAEIIRLSQTPAVSQAVYLFELCTGGTLLTKLEATCRAAAQADKGTQMLYCCPCLQQEEVIEVLCSTAQALSYLSRLGMIHYDVKSENLLLGGDGLWKLGDFGSASERSFDLEGAPKKAVLEAQQFIDGRCTPIYRAPELADVYLRWKIGPKVDVFALGCILFATLTGQHPFPMDSACANISASYRTPPEAEAAYAPAVLRWLRRLLAREPWARPTAVKLAAEIEAYRMLGEEPPGPCAAAEAPAKAAAKRVGAAKAPAEQGPAWVADFSSFAPAPAAPRLQEAQQDRPGAGVAAAAAAADAEAGGAAAAAADVGEAAAGEAAAGEAAAGEAAAAEAAAAEAAAIGEAASGEATSGEAAAEVLGEGADEA